ncbi:MAG: hypothetical protein EA397_19315 [Deltaproteobacteria bacterium]|nr:MAG: hypothetical protein EA397_19315 [Deltaproteobacteria bacterium]
MGSVYRCRHSLSERIEAAVKVLEPSGIPGERERFIREAEALHALRHPAIVRITGFGTDAATELPFLAMELVEGDDFDRLITRGTFPRHRIDEIFATLADGLAYAHGRGVFHRDLKPANLMLQADGAPVLLDFGIAVQEGQERLTQDGVVPGTIAYAAPEQLRDGVQLDPALCDLYALGQVLCECLRGELTYPRKPDVRDHQRSVQILRAKLKIEPLDPGEGVSRGVRELVRGATQPDPAHRGPPFSEWRRVFETQTLWADRQSDEATALGAAPTGSRKRPDLPLDVALPGEPPSYQDLHEVETLPEGSLTSTGVRRRRTVGLVLGSAGAVLAFGITFLLTLVIGGIVLWFGAGRSGDGWGSVEPVEPAPTFRLGDVLLEELPEVEEVEIAEVALQEPPVEPDPPAPVRQPRQTVTRSDGETKLVVAADVPAKIFLDGELIRSSPLVRRLEPGTYKVEIQASGDRKRTFSVKLSPGETTRRIWSFQQGEWRSFEGGVDPRGLPMRPSTAGMSNQLSRLPETRACIEDVGMDRPQKMALVIVPDGTVVAEGLVGEKKGSALDYCLRRAARKLRFKPSVTGAALNVEIAP